jgi:Pyridoxamine 5'-phosphate oxidase
MSKSSRPVRRIGMADIDPIEVTNLDIYGNPPLEWSRARAQLATWNGSAVSHFLCTVRPDGRPHVAGVGATWLDGDLYIVSGDGTRKSKNLAARPACSIAVRLPGIDMTLDGTATRVMDGQTLERVAALYHQVGWPAEVDAAAHAFTAPFSAPSAGPPPWQLYRFVFHTAFGVASEEPLGATRWRFARS